MGAFLAFLRPNNGGNEDLPTKGSVWLSILKKVGEVHGCLKAKLESLFQCLSNSLWKNLQAVADFLTYCCETLKEGLSWIVNEVKNLFRNKDVPVPEEPSQNLAEMIKMDARKAKEVVYQSFEFKDDSPHHKLNRFFDFAQGFCELLEYGPMKLALVFLEAIFIYCSIKCGGAMTKKRSLTVAGSLVSYILHLEVW